MAERPTITIVGTGLIGTSLGMALMQARGKDLDVIGHDKDSGQAATARRMGAVNKVERNLISACSKADLVILAVPTPEIHDVLELIAGDLKPGAVVHDTGSVKVPVLQWADALLSPEVSYVGGDPILFGDEAGIDSARADLLKDALYCVVPSTKASSEAIKLVTDLVGLTGAIPHFIDPYEHDGLIAATEHLADVVATAMLRTLSSSGGWRDMRRMCGATFDRVTCFSASDPAEYVARVLLNRENIVRWIDNMQNQLITMRTLIERQDAEALGKLFETEMQNRLQWLQDRAKGDWGDQPEKTDLPTSGEMMSNMLLGGFGRRRRQD